MIKEKEIEIRIFSSNFKHFYEKYGPYHKNDIINVKIEDLTENSTVKITAICEICGDENKVVYQNYKIQVKKSNYYCCKKCKTIKTKNTNINRYGFEWGLSSENIKEKSKKTVFEKYDVTNISQCADIKKKKIKTCLKNYGVEHYTTTPEHKKRVKITCLKRYNVDNPSKFRDFQIKKESTLMLNYGVTNPSQSGVLFEKSQKSGKKIKLHKETNLYYRGTYELDFLNFCYQNKIDVKKGPSINFLYNNKNKFYHSDYFIPKYNLVCEIKSDYYYEKYLELNLVKEIETIKLDYNFIFIINKHYENFVKYLK